MNEIGTIPVRVALDLAQRHGVETDALLQGLTLEPEDAREGRAHFQWDDFAVFLERVADSLGGEAKVEALGASLVREVPEMVALARPFVDPERLLRFLLLAAQPVAWPALRPEIEQEDDGRLALTARLLPGYRDCSTFFRALSGALQALPGVLDLPPAEVEAETGPRHGVYRIRLPKSDAKTNGSRKGRGKAPDRPFWDEALDHLEADKRRLSEALEALRRADQELERRGAQLEGEARERRRLEATLRAVLEGLTASAFLVGPEGVRPANDSARSALSRSNGALTGALQEAVRIPAGGQDAAGEELQVTPLGEDGRFLVIRCSVEDEIDDRLRRAEARWGLTSRQLEVLRRLVDGQGNKEIARDLDCSVKTVEAHVTALLDRADADSRLSVVAAFWADL